jgi:hypothetical protein
MRARAARVDNVVVRCSVSLRGPRDDRDDHTRNLAEPDRPSHRLRSDAVPHHIGAEDPFATQFSLSHLESP